MKKETVITLTPGETRTYERHLWSLEGLSRTDIKKIDNCNSERPKYEVSFEFMFAVVNIINTISGCEFNFLDR